MSISWENSGPGSQCRNAMSMVEPTGDPAKLPIPTGAYLPVTVCHASLAGTTLLVPSASEMMRLEFAPGAKLKFPPLGNAGRLASWMSDHVLAAPSVQVLASTRVIG